HITLIGLPNAAGLVERYANYLDELVAFPGLPGMPEQSPTGDLPAFYAHAQAQQYDIAIQLHGSGQLTNPVVQQLGARYTAGFLPEGPATQSIKLRTTHPAAEHWLPWPNHLPEILRYTALMEHLGIAVDSTELEFPLTAQDHE